MSSTLLAVYIGLICAAVLVLIVLLVINIVRRWRADKDTRGLENYICVNGRVYRVVLTDEEYIAMPETGLQPAPATNVVINNVVPAQPAAEPAPDGETQHAEDARQTAVEPATEPQPEIEGMPEDSEHRTADEPSSENTETAEEATAEPLPEEGVEPAKVVEVEAEPVAKDGITPAPQTTTINIFNIAPSEGTNAKAEEAPKVSSETTPAPAPSDASEPRVTVVKTEYIEKSAGPSVKNTKGTEDELDEILKIVPREAEKDAEKEHEALSDGASIFASAYKHLSDEKKKYVQEIINYAMAMDSRAVTKDSKHYRSVYLGDVPIIHVYIMKGTVRTRVPSENIEEIKGSSGGVMRSVTFPVGGVVENRENIAETMHHIELAYSLIRGDGNGPVDAKGKTVDTDVEERIEIVPRVAEEDAEKEHTALSDGASIFAAAYKNLSDEKKGYVDEIISYAMSLDSSAETRDFKHYRSVYLGYVPVVHVYIVKGVVRTRLPAESMKEIKVSARGVRRTVTRPVGGVVESKQNVAENMEHIDIAYSLIRSAKVYTVEHRDGLKIGLGEAEEKQNGKK